MTSPYMRYALAVDGSEPVEPDVADVSNARRELHPQQVEECEHEICAVSVVCSTISSSVSLSRMPSST